MHAYIHTLSIGKVERQQRGKKKGSSRYKSGEGDDVGKDPVGGVQSSAHMELHPLLLSTVVGETEIAIRLFTKKNCVSAANAKRTNNLQHFTIVKNSDFPATKSSPSPGASPHS
jgi:hypothetical protein